jgi:hypothetical protein
MRLKRQACGRRRRAWSLPLSIVVASSCSSRAPRVVDITAINYAFQAPATIPPGPARFRLVNAGTVPHEVQLFVFKPGVSADSGRALLNRLDRVPDSLADSSGAVLIAAPHTTAPEELYVDLQPGRVYALLCQFRDSAKAQRHDRLGMFGVLQVAQGTRE